MPLSIIFYLYHDGQFYCWMKLEYPVKTTICLKLVTDNLSHKRLHHNYHQGHKLKWTTMVLTYLTEAHTWLLCWRKPLLLQNRQIPMGKLYHKFKKVVFPPLWSLVLFQVHRAVYNEVCHYSEIDGLTWSVHVCKLYHNKKKNVFMRLWGFL